MCYLGLLFELNCGELDIGIRISITKIWSRRDCTWTGLREVGIHRGGEMVGFWMREESGQYPDGKHRLAARALAVTFGIRAMVFKMIFGVYRE